MTILHAGGKFDSDSYAVSGGLHGVGISVVNALSTRLDVEIHRDGKYYEQTYNYAKPTPLKELGNSSKTGTTITYWADGDIFETTEYNIETVSRRLQEMAFLNKGLTINLRDERRKEAELVELAEIGAVGRTGLRRDAGRKGRSSRSSGPSITRAGSSITSSTSTPPRIRSTRRSSGSR